MAVAAGVAAGAACAASAAAWWAAINGSRTLKRAREDSRNSHRPMVAAYFEKIPYVHGSQRLVITNLGRSVARNLQVTFDPEIPDPTPEEEHRSTAKFVKQRFANPIPVLVPGLMLQDVWFLGQPGPDGKYVNIEPTPSQVTVIASYDGPDGKHYEDRFPLDIELIQFETTFEASSSPDGRAKDALAEIKKIATAVTALAKNSQR